MRNLQRLAVNAATMFALDDRGRILHENDPDASPGPRLSLLGCADGNCVHLRHDVSDVVAERAMLAAGSEPPWQDPLRPPACLPLLLEIFGEVDRAPTVTTSAIYALPHGLAVADQLEFLSSGTEEGEAWLTRMARDGMPAKAVAAGFVDAGELWPPWCMVLEANELASAAFAARSGKSGVEVGVYTFDDFRGRGLAAAVTAKWSNLPQLAGRELFYSANIANAPSHRVAAKLGLQRIGAGLRVA